MKSKADEPSRALDRRYNDVLPNQCHRPDRLAAADSSYTHLQRWRRFPISVGHDAILLELYLTVLGPCDTHRTRCSDCHTRVGRGPLLRGLTCGRASILLSHWFKRTVPASIGNIQQLPVGAHVAARYAVRSEIERAKDAVGGLAESLHECTRVIPV